MFLDDILIFEKLFFSKISQLGDHCSDFCIIWENGQSRGEFFLIKKNLAFDYF